jgi:ferredoxin
MSKSIMESNGEDAARLERARHNEERCTECEDIEDLNAKNVQARLLKV